MTLRLLTYNIRSLRDDEAAVVRVIRDAAPHIACIQEAPRFARSSAKIRRLAQRSGLRAVTGGRSAAGNLLLSHPDIRTETVVATKLSRHLGLHRRGVVLGVFRWTEFIRIAVVGIHLDLDRAERLRHATEILKIIRSTVDTGIPVVIAGDVNEEPSGEAWSLFSRYFVDLASAAGISGKTFSATNPVRQIDGVFASDNCGVRSYRILDSPDVRKGSDHRPILAELAIQGADRIPG